MSLRRSLADLVDPDRLLEIQELRETTIVAAGARDAMQAALVAERIQGALLRVELQTARADVARLLEAAAQCAHEHHQS